MDSSKQFYQKLDRFLIAGLGCGIIGLCCLAFGFIYTFRNPPGQRPVATQTLPGTATFSTVPPDLTTPTSALETPTFFPTLTSVAATGPAVVSPAPQPSVGDTPPTGKIVFTCYVQQIDQICLMNADGSGRRQLTNFKATTFYPSISPDGDAIYFISRENGNFDIYTMNPNGKGVKQLTKGIGTLYAPELSPNGKRIVFTNNGNGIWVMRPDGKNAHAISHKDDIDPTWSPDGMRIAFASSRSGQRQLYVMDSDGSDVEQLTDLNNMGGRSTWSPDGTKIAFYRGPEGDHNIFVVDVATKSITRLTSGGDNLGPSWSPDGNWIAFTSFRDGNNEIYIIHPDGKGLTRLTNSPTSDWQPRWGK
ncbi:MAG: DPP IV N-terminal domain-containing protein [Syntrophothermus sp.]